MVDMSLYLNAPVNQLMGVLYNTETALLKGRNDILLNMNKQHVTLLVLLDLSAAFDTIKHNMSLEALNTLGPGARVFKWFQLYLSGCSQRILVCWCLVEKFDLNWGVPLGCCLGLPLFTIYMSLLLDVVTKYLLSFHCYADDTQLYISFGLAVETGHLDAIAAIECCIKAIRCWMHENKVVLKVEKN